MRWLAVILLWATQAHAQQIDCVNPTSQVEMTGCAGLAWEAADAELNAAYKLARDLTRRMDAGQPGLEPSNEVMLRDAQRAWIPFRDAACAAESNLARGGSMQNQIYLICLERLTRRRTQDLLDFASVN